MANYVLTVKHEQIQIPSKLLSTVVQSSENSYENSLAGFIRKVSFSIP